MRRYFLGPTNGNPEICLENPSCKKAHEVWVWDVLTFSWLWFFVIVFVVVVGRGGLFVFL